MKVNQAVVFGAAVGALIGLYLAEVHPDLGRSSGESLKSGLQRAFGEATKPYWRNLALGALAGAFLGALAPKKR